MNLKNTCGYITFVNTGVPDIGCEEFEIDIKLQRPISKAKKAGKAETVIQNENYDVKRPSQLPDIPINFVADLQSPLDSTEITSFNKNKTIIDSVVSNLKSPDENHFAESPKNSSPSNVYRSIDCNELLEKELEKLDESDKKVSKYMVSQSSIEIDIEHAADGEKEEEKSEYVGEEWTVMDVNFGVPLFDVDCNTRICQYIIKDLATEEK